jgi:hypothetical protein
MIPDQFSSLEHILKLQSELRCITSQESGFGSERFMTITIAESGYDTYSNAASGGGVSKKFLAAIFPRLMPGDHA